MNTCEEECGRNKRTARVVLFNHARIMGHDEQPACSPCSVPTGTGLVTATASKLLWLVWEMERRRTGEYGRRIHIASSAGASEVILGPRSTLVSCHLATLNTSQITRTNNTWLLPASDGLDNHHLHQHECETRLRTASAVV